MAASKTIFYDGKKHAYDEVQKFLDDQGINYQASKRMAYDPPEVPAEWPEKGILLSRHDISIQPPQDNIQFGFVGRIDCATKGRAIHSPSENRKIFTLLKKEFALSEAELDERIG